MLNEIPYKKIMEHGRRYEVWVLRDIYENTFADIAGEYGVSVACIMSDYEKILLLKMQCYVNHLSLVYGYEDTAHFRSIWSSANDCYCSRKYIVAYFEKEYAAILSAYRNGEPGMPERFLQDLPPLRTKFSKQTVSSVIRLRETDGMTYAAIGKRLRMTKEKAEHLYNSYYHNLYYTLTEKLIETTGDKNLRDKYRKNFQVGNGKKKYDCLINDYPELRKNNVPAEKQK